ncbi:MAG TPA: hypothetical protein DCX89_06195 [Saprospirales bacterium]|nr:hypothetical protein [Saprospirales bacterium]
MHDKSSYSSNNKPEISEALQNFINALVEEVVLKGEVFDDQKKKWLRKYVEAEGLIGFSIEQNFQDFFQAINNINELTSTLIIKMLKQAADDLFISGVLIEKIIESKKNNAAKDHFLIPFRQGKKWGFVDKDKRLHIPAEFEETWPFFDGLALVRKQSKFGFINTNGNIIIPITLFRSRSFDSGLAFVKDVKNNLYGCLDNKGNQILNFEYELSSNTKFSEGLAPVSKNGKYGFIDIYGNVVIPFQFDFAYPFSDGLAYVSLGNKYFHIDKYGRTMTHLSNISNIRSFSEGLAKWEYLSKGGYVDLSGNEVISRKYDECGNFSEGIAFVKLNGKWGGIDRNDNTIIPFEYEYINFPDSQFSEGLANVRLITPDLNNLVYYGYINRNNQIIIPFKYARGGPFQNGITYVYLHDRNIGYIDKMGTEYWED